MKQETYPPFATVLKRIVAVLFLLATGVFMTLVVYIGAGVYTSNETKADAILILGSRSYYGNRINPCLEARVAHGTALYNAGYADTLIVSGGLDQELGVTEAETMAGIATRMGVPEENILLEKQATSTYENILYTRRIMNLYGLHDLIIVTEPYHVPRASLIAEEHDVPHAMSYAPGSPCWERWTFLSRYFLREVFATYYYAATGKL
jgi:uncharacterized SAM-binding protein YcdF (DUF218 family)